MPAARKGGSKKRAAAAVEDSSQPLAAAAVAAEVHPETEEAASSATAAAEPSKGNKKAKHDVVFVTERDPLPAKPALPAGRGFKVHLRACVCALLSLCILSWDSSRRAPTTRLNQ